MEAVRGQNHTSEAKEGMKELIHSIKYLIKVSQQPQNPLAGAVRFELQPQGKKL